MRRSQDTGRDPLVIGGALSAVEMPTINGIVQACRPDTLSQRNVEALTGIPSRTYLELVRDASFSIPVAKIGKLRVVNRRAFLAWIEQRGAASRHSPTMVESIRRPQMKEEEEAELDADAERVLAEMGMRLLPAPFPTPSKSQERTPPPRRAPRRG